MLLNESFKTLQTVKKVHNNSKIVLYFKAFKELAQQMPYIEHNDNKIDDNKNKLIIVNVPTNKNKTIGTPQPLQIKIKI